ncbi:MAG TPA: hypothetical protein VFK13_03740 [Gemmatimonadaceae bacterium]|nr:hypothetical protein [Gemmatimonadaceae bacterium]
MRISRYRLALVLLASVLAACSTPSGQLPPPQRPVPRPSTPAPSRTVAHWQPLLVPGYTSYDIATSTLIQEGDSTAALMTDSSTTRVAVTLTLQPTAGGLAAVVTLDSATLQWGDSTAVLPANVQHSSNSVFLTNTGAQQAGQALAPVACDSAAPISVPVQQLVVALPDTVQVGSSWEDTTSMTTCRAALPISVAARHSYHVVRSDPSIAGTALVIQRSSELRYSAGDSSGGGYALLLTGTGHGSGTLLVDAEHGALIAATDTLTATFSVQTANAVSIFSQHATRDIRQRP